VGNTNPSNDGRNWRLMHQLLFSLSDLVVYLANNKTELVASILGFISVYLVIKESIWNFPIGIVMVSLYLFVFYDQKLYSDMWLQVFFIIMQFYGWYNWMYGGGNEHKKITPSSTADIDTNSTALVDSALRINILSSKKRLMWFLVSVFLACSIGKFMSANTGAALPYWDASTTSLSIVAQWLLSKKKIENWILWIVADVLYIGIYFSKQLYLTTLLYFVFLVLAIIGLIEWRRIFKKSQIGY
jgi:nicotinamide mononucleotide transporter